MVLDYTARSIREIETETRKSIVELLQEFSMSTIHLFVKKGLGIGANAEEADKVIEEYLADGKDIFELYIEILELLRNKGFLPKSVDFQSVKQAQEIKTEVKAE